MINHSGANTKAAIRKCSVEKVLLKNFTKFKENTCARVSFKKKLQASNLPIYLKKDSSIGVLFLIFNNNSDGCFWKYWKRLLLKEKKKQMVKLFEINVKLQGFIQKEPFKGA